MIKKSNEECGAKNIPLCFPFIPSFLSPKINEEKLFNGTRREEKERENEIIFTQMLMFGNTAAAAPHSIISFFFLPHICRRTLFFFHFILVSCIQRLPVSIPFFSPLILIQVLFRAPYLISISLFVLLIRSFLLSFLPYFFLVSQA